MSFTERLAEIRTGFKRAFWVANFSELFERLAYYAMSAVLAIYLTEQLHFSKEVTGWMMGTFGFVVWFLPVLGGTLADRFGFRRALMFAYLVMTVGYFLLGSVSAPWMHTMRQALGDKWLVLVFLLVLALGPGMVKPCVVGTTAHASSENVRSIGYSIYYTLVSVGAMLGPVVAWLVRKRLGWGMENVFRVSALSVFLMFLVTMVFFRDPDHSGEQKVESVADAIRNMFVVLHNFRFVLFLFIYSSFYIVYWQEFISAPLFLRGYVNPNANVDLLLSIDALTICCFQIPATYLTRKIPTFPALTLGLLITSLAWVVLAVYPSTLGLAATLVVVALGEIMQSPRYFEYISRLAPPGQQGLYMGYSFLPIAIGYFIAGPLGTYLLHEFGDVLHRPRQMWWVVTAVGLVGVVLMVIYDKVFKPGEGQTPESAT
jgi:POT family proton-dependent oligopeptide transporter